MLHLYEDVQHMLYMFIYSKTNAVYMLSEERLEMYMFIYSKTTDAVNQEERAGETAEATGRTTMERVTHMNVYSSTRTTIERNEQ